MEHMSKFSVTKIVKERIGSCYLLTEIKPFTLILLGLNIFFKGIEQNQRHDHHAQNI